jgi:cysteinyl-tRNA synthetase
MSKSLGNFFTVRDLLDQGIPGEVIRFVMLSTHYRKPMDWTEKKREEAEKTLRKWRELVKDVSTSEAPHDIVIERLSDDLNTPLALTGLHTLAKSSEIGGHGVARFKASANLLGLLLDEAGDWIDDEPESPADWFVAKAEFWIEERAKAKSAKDFARADFIRDTLARIGVMLSDSPEGTTWMLNSQAEETGNWELLK